MNDQNDTSQQGRVEDLLRQWGAVEAAKLADRELASPVVQRTATPPIMPDPRRSRSGLFFRWIPVGIAASLLLASSVVFMKSRQGAPAHGNLARSQHREPVVSAPKAVETRPADLSGELAAALRETIKAQNEARQSAAALSKAKSDLSEANARKLIADKKIEDLLAAKKRLEKDLAEKADMDKAYDTLMAKLEKEVSETRTRLAVAEKKLRDAETRPAAPVADPDEIKKLKTRLAAANSELARQREEFKISAAEPDKLTREITSLKTARRARLNQMRRIYLSAAAPDKTGLAALQDAVKNRKLVRRCSTLQEKAIGVSEKKLLARTEVVLTRLGLLEVSDPSAVRAFATQLKKSDLIAALDNVTGSLATDAAAQDWLLETRLILTGVQSVA